MERYSYVAVLAGVLLGSLWLEAVARTRVLRRARRAALSIAPVLLVFVVWDAYAIDSGHWTFDAGHVVGLKPTCGRSHRRGALLRRRAPGVDSHPGGSAVCARLGCGRRAASQESEPVDVTYTQLAVLGVGAGVVIDLAVLRTRILARKAFWVSYAIIVFFQLVTNGVLTGFSIVQYSADDIVGSNRVQFLGDGRIAYAPVEDLLVRIRGCRSHAFAVGVVGTPGRPVRATGGSADVAA